MTDVENQRFLLGRDIIIRDGVIAGIRPSAPSLPQMEEEIDGTGMVALPGFVNTHTHLWQHLAKGFEPASQLQDWISIYRYSHYLTGEELYQVTRAAAGEALLSGITTVLDFSSVNVSEFALDTTLGALQRMRVVVVSSGGIQRPSCPSTSRRRSSSGWGAALLRT